MCVCVCVRVCVCVWRYSESPNSAAPAVCPSLENVTAECHRKESPAGRGGAGRGVGVA